MSRAAGGVGRWALIIAALIGSVAGAELVARIVDGQPLSHWHLRSGGIPQPAAARPPDAREALELLGELPVPRGLPLDTFLSDPPVVRSHQPSEEAIALDRRVAELGMSRADMFKAWNRNYVQRQLCGWSRPGQFAGFPGFAYVFEPTGSSIYPRYRFFPSTATPLGLVTNRFGWRGRELEVTKPEDVVRIAFLGASTTVEMHGSQWAWPEYVERWLNIWARNRGYGVRFEALNTAREGIDSPDIAAIVREELPPAEPDVLVYHEGSNQFSFRRLLSGADASPPPARAGVDLASYSALFRRLAALALAFGLVDGGEGAQSKYELRWPRGLDPERPRLDYPELPLDLNRVLADLDEIRGEADRLSATLVMTSFVWMVWDGMELDPERQPAFASYLRYLRDDMAPYRWRDVRGMADFQNRVFETWAATRRVAFVDVAREFPEEPRLFFDPIHTFPAGSRVRAWIVTLGLIPILERRLESTELPRSVRRHDVRRPYPSVVHRVNLEKIDRRCRQ